MGLFGDVKLSEAIEKIRKETVLFSEPSSISLNEYTTFLREKQEQEFVFNNNENDTD